MSGNDEDTRRRTKKKGGHGLGTWRTDYSGRRTLEGMNFPAELQQTEDSRIKTREAFWFQWDEDGRTWC